MRSPYCAIEKNSNVCDYRLIKKRAGRKQKVLCIIIDNQLRALTISKEGEYDGVEKCVVVGLDLQSHR